jgi:hypothetical protein
MKSQICFYDHQLSLGIQQLELKKGIWHNYCIATIDIKERDLYCVFTVQLIDFEMCDNVSRVLVVEGADTLECVNKVIMNYEGIPEGQQRLAFECRSVPEGRNRRETIEEDRAKKVQYYNLMEGMRAMLIELLNTKF